MNNDLFRRSELKDVLEKRQWYIDDIDEVEKIIDNLPTVKAFTVDEGKEIGQATMEQVRISCNWQPLPEPYKKGGECMSVCNHLCTGYYYGCNFRTYDGYCTFSEHIKPIEKDFARQTGEWINPYLSSVTGEFSAKCNICGEDIIVSSSHHNFCPNCGCDMRGEK